MDALHPRMLKLFSYWLCRGMQLKVLQFRLFLVRLNQAWPIDIPGKQNFSQATTFNYNHIHNKGKS